MIGPISAMLDCHKVDICLSNQKRDRLNSKADSPKCSEKKQHIHKSYKSYIMYKSYCTYKNTTRPNCVFWFPPDFGSRSGSSSDIRSGPKGPLRPQRPWRSQGHPQPLLGKNLSAKWMWQPISNTPQCIWKAGVLPSFIQFPWSSCLSSCLSSYFFHPLSVATWSAGPSWRRRQGSLLVHDIDDGAPLVTKVSGSSHEQPRPENYTQW